MPKHLFVENSINYALVYRVYFKVDKAVTLLYMGRETLRDEGKKD
jgi:hypothetical protein